jgi:hypothetical protein
MPFDYNLDRIQNPNNNIFVHEEVRIPKSLVTFLNSTSFVPTVNNIPLNGQAVAVDPYTSESDYFVHYLINKGAINQLAQIQNTGSNEDGYDKVTLMNFSLSINSAQDVNDITSSQLVTSSGIKVILSWQPGDLSSNVDSVLNLRFLDDQNIPNLTNSSHDVPIDANVSYSLTILDKNGTKFLHRDDLMAINGNDSQSIKFPLDDTYQIVVNVTGIKSDGKELDESRNGIGTGIVVVPEFALPPVGLLCGAIASIAVIVRINSRSQK